MTHKKNSNDKSNHLQKDKIVDIKNDESDNIPTSPQKLDESEIKKQQSQSLDPKSFKDAIKKLKNSQEKNKNLSNKLALYKDYENDEKSLEIQNRTRQIQTQILKVRNQITESQPFVFQMENLISSIKSTSQALNKTQSQAHIQKEPPLKHPGSLKSELSKMGWTVRGLILGVLGIILLVKLYMTFFVVDFTVGLYSTITGIMLFGYFFLAYVKFRDPYKSAYDKLDPKYQPLLSVVIPVKNEESLIKNCVKSFLSSTYENKEIIVVNDGSTDKTPEILDELARTSNIKVIHIPKSVGKKRAIEKGLEFAHGKFYFFTDSDSEVAPDALEKTMAIFMSDEKIGAVTGHGRIKSSSSKLNFLEKMQDVLYDNNFRILKGAESSYSSITCCSGPVTAYRKEAVKPHIQAWTGDKFFGKEFKFATDRRLTAFVLGGHGTEINTTELVQHPSSEEPSSKFSWKLVYSPSIKVMVGTPFKFKSYASQQIRWRKSFIRSLFSTGKIYWKRPLPIATLVYLQMGLKLARPFIIFKSLVLLPLAGDFVSASLYFASIFTMSMVYTMDFKLRNPTTKHWYYRPAMTFFQTFVISWLIFYSLATIRKTKWR